MELLGIVLLAGSSVALALVARKFYGTWLNPVLAFCVLSLFHNWIGTLIGLFVEVEWDYYSTARARTAVLYVNLAGLWCFALGAWLTRRSGARRRTGPATTRRPWQGRPRTRFYLGAFCLEVLISLLSGGRKGLVITAAGLLVAYASTHHVRARSLWRPGLVMLVLGYLAVAINVWRAGATLPFHQRVEMVVKDMSSEALGQNVVKGFMSANSEGVQSWVYRLWFQRGHQPLLYGRSYVQAFVNLIVPRRLQGDLVNYQAAYYFKDRAYRGATRTGYDFTFTAEAMLNFGPYLAGLSFIALGMGVGTVYARWRHTGSVSWAMLYFYTLAVLSIGLRTDSTGLFRFLWFGYVPTLILVHLLSHGKVAVSALAGYRRLPRLWRWLYPAPPVPRASSATPAAGPVGTAQVRLARSTSPSGGGSCA